MGQSDQKNQITPSIGSRQMRLKPGQQNQQPGHVGQQGGQRKPGQQHYATPPGLNSGEPWSAWDDKDLRHAANHGDSVEATAAFLQRTPDEVRARAEELKVGFGLFGQERPEVRRG